MPCLFSYRAREQNGKIVKGVLKANNMVSAAKILQDSNYIVTDIKPVKKKLWDYGTFQKFARNHTNKKELSLYCRQFATMIEAGVPIINSLKVLAKQTGSKTLAKTSEKMVVALNEGRNLTETVQQFHGVFPKIFSALIEAGESSGTLGRSFEQLAVHFEKEYSLSEKIKSALLYPLLVFVFSIIVIFILVIFVLPQLVDMMVLQNVNIPFVTQLILVVAGFFRENWAFLFLGLIFCWLVLKNIFKSEKGSRFLDVLTLRIPVVGSLYKKEMICRFSRNLAVLLRCGVPVQQSLDIVQSMLGSRVFAGAVQDVKVSIVEGLGLSEPLARNKIFPPMVIQMIRVGELSGALDNLLEKIADFYDREATELVNRLSNLIEPVLILFVGAVIAVVLFSVIMPVFKIMNSI